MKTTHADEQSIQQYIFDVDTCDTNVVMHINSCDICLEIADGYRILATDLKEQEVPVLGFNLEDLILHQITNRIAQERSPKKYAFVGPLIVIAIGIIAILSNTLIIELKDLVDVENLSTYFIICIGLIIAILLSMDIVRIFKSKMYKINFS